MSSGSKVCKAVQVLKEHQVSFGFVIIWCDVPSVEILLVDTFLFPQSYWKVPEDHIILINLFCTPAAARRIVDENPNVRSTFLPGALRKHFNVLRVLHPSDDRPNNGASLSDPKSLWPALLRHRSCGLGGSIHVGRAYGTAANQCCCFAVIWIYGLCCHQSWEFNIVHYASKSYLIEICHILHSVTHQKNCNYFELLYRDGICPVQRNTAWPCLAGGTWWDGGVWADLAQCQIGCA